jgi:hypothetical protein
MLAPASPPRVSRRDLLTRDLQERLVLLAGLGWGALIWGLVIGDVIAELPPRPPTPAEVAAGRPRAEAKWRIVRAMLVGRLDQRSPLEFGAVWATRTGVVCGLVNGWSSFGGLTGMTRFIAVTDTPAFIYDAPSDEAAKRFNLQWVTCRSDPWIVLRDGSPETGFCATRMGQRLCAAASAVATPAKSRVSASQARR